MDAPQTTEEEPIPECAEIKLAYDLAAIPLLGLICYPFLAFIVDIKLKRETDSRLFWFKKINHRLWKSTGIPFIIAGAIFAGRHKKGTAIIAGVLLLLAAIVPSFLPPQRAHHLPEGIMYHLRSIFFAQAEYSYKYKRYAPSLSVLVKSGVFKEQNFRVCERPGQDSPPTLGYVFQMTAGRNWTATQFYVRCRPDVTARPPSGWDIYLAIDQSGRVVTTDAYQ